MSIFSKLFGNKNKNDDKPPIYGGDGLSDNSPAIVNCAGMGMAQALIDSFISEKCGDDWERRTEFTISSPSDSNKLLRLICVQTSDGNDHKFHFDLSRPVGVAKKMSGLS